jgi:hypothetical protein
VSRSFGFPDRTDASKIGWQLSHRLTDYMGEAGFDGGPQGPLATIANGLTAVLAAFPGGEKRWCLLRSNRLDSRGHAEELRQVAVPTLRDDTRNGGGSHTAALPVNGRHEYPMGSRRGSGA